jgi:hypothetical protein
MQPGVVWNADGDVKQEGAFASVIKLAFHLLKSFCLYTAGAKNIKEHLVRPLLIIRNITELFFGSQKIFVQCHIFRRWAEVKNLGYYTRTGNS